MMNYFCKFFIALSVLYFVFNESCADILNIPEEYLFIQDAIDNSQVGDTLLLSEGLFEESINIYNHGLTLAGLYILNNDTSYIENTILHPFENERIVTIDSSVNTPVIVVGITFEDGFISEGTAKGGAIYSIHADMSVDHCLFQDNQADQGGAIFYDSGILEITNCRFYN